MALTEIRKIYRFFCKSTHINAERAAISTCARRKL